MPDGWNQNPKLRQTVLDAVIALAVAGAVAVSPFVPARPGFKETTFAVLAAGVFLYRWRSARGEAEAAEAAAADTPTSTGLAIPLPVLLCLAGFALLFQQTFHWMYRQWTINVWLNTHGIFIPPLVLYLAWVVLQRDRSREPASSAWGFAFLLPACALFLLDLSLRTRFLSSVALVLALPGLSLLFLGTRRTLALKLPLLIAAFMVPIPFLVSSVLFLREVTTAGVVALLRIGGQAVYSTGTVIHLAWGPFQVSEACSGLATFYSAIAMAVVFAGLSDSAPRRVALFAAAIPLAIASNVARVILLVLLARWFGNEILDTAIHEGSGAATFVVVFVALYQIANARKVTRSPA